MASSGITCPDYSLSNHTDVAYSLVAINITASIVGTFGNVLVCVAVFTTTKMTSSFHYFISSLAAADLAVCSVDQPLLVILILARLHSECRPNVDAVFRVVGNLACAVSLLTLASIALDRCLFVTQMFTYKNTLTRGKKVALVVVWVFAGVYATLRLTIDKKITSYLTATIFGIGYIEMIICYAITYHQVLKRRKLLLHDARLRQGERVGRSEKETSVETSLTEDNNMERRFARTIVMVVAFFSFAWFLLFYLRLTQPDKNYGVMYNVARTVALSSSALNPVLYGFNNKVYRRAFKRILKRICCCGRPRNSMEKYERLK